MLKDKPREILLDLDLDTEHYKKAWSWKLKKSSTLQEKV